MTYVPHLRLSWGGDLPGGEMFSCSVSLVPDTNAFETAITSGQGIIGLLNDLMANVNLTDDLATDVSAYHARPATAISTRCHLRRVKLAALDADGHYVGAAKEVALDTPGQGNGSDLPNQMSRKITLHTAGDLGRIKGGWYLPGATTDGWDPATQETSPNTTGNIQDSTATFIAALENAPGLDANSFRVVVASQGRRNKNGSVRVPPVNQDVTGVSVGKRLDVQRRRANKISELRPAVTGV